LAAANASVRATAAAVGGGPRPDDDPIVARGILRRDGERIVDATGRPVRWVGVGFGNQVWSGRALPVADHDESDFSRLRAMGMNAARFYMHDRTFEDDSAPGVFKEAGWQWLDHNVTWARRHGVYLILNLHVPPGGYQSNGEGADLWESPSSQRPCFEKDRGGLSWIEDVLDFADERGLPFTYHDYHGDSFGLYLGSGRVDPARANHPLIALFKRRLASPGPVTRAQPSK
jgi:hypothetical protein